MSKKLFYSLREYREMTGRSATSTTRDIRSGRVPVVIIGRNKLVPASYFENLISEAFNLNEVPNGGAA